MKSNQHEVIFTIVNSGFAAEQKTRHSFRNASFLWIHYLRDSSRASIFLMGSMMEPTLISWLIAAMK